MDKTLWKYKDEFRLNSDILMESYLLAYSIDSQAKNLEGSQL